MSLKYQYFKLSGSNAPPKIYPAGQWPRDRMQASGYRVKFTPAFSSASVAASTWIIVMNEGSFYGLQLVNDGTTYGLSMILPASFWSTPISHGAGQPLDVTLRPTTGQVTIAGATTGNGSFSFSPWSMGTGIMDVGDLSDTAFNGTFQAIEGI